MFAFLISQQTLQCVCVCSLDLQLCLFLFHPVTLNRSAFVSRRARFCIFVAQLFPDELHDRRSPFLPFLCSFSPVELRTFNHFHLTAKEFSTDFTAHSVPHTQIHRLEVNITMEMMSLLCLRVRFDFKVYSCVCTAVGYCLMQ